MTDLPRTRRLEEAIDESLDLAIDAELAGDSDKAVIYLGHMWRFGLLMEQSERLALSDIDWPGGDAA